MGRLNDEMHRLVEKNFEKQMLCTQDMIRRKSVLDEKNSSKQHPFGFDLSHALDAFLSVASRMGFRVKNLDNYAGYAEIGDTDAPLTGILAHIDVVPEGALEQWTYPPYEAKIADGYLWGRGAVDDKGPAVASLFAMYALMNTVPLRRRFRLILGLDEENGSRCIKYYKERAEIPEYSFSPDASFPVVNAEKGILRFIVTISREYKNNEICLKSIRGGDRFNVVPDTAEAEFDGGSGRAVLKAQGKSAHAMEPYKGENAIQKLLCRLKDMPLNDKTRALVNSVAAAAGDDCLGKSLGIECFDKVSGNLTCNCAAIESTIDCGVMNVCVKFDVRYPVTADYDDILSKVNARVSELGAAMEIATHKPPLFMPEDNAVVQTLLDAYEKVTGERERPVSMGGGTYCRFMPNSVSAGPVFPKEEETAHQPNERITLADLKKCTHIYAEALFKFNGGEE